MNKVTSYLKNMGKSVAYATVEVSKTKLFPEVAEFTETNDEIFKSIYATVSNSRQSIKYGTDYIKRSQIYKDINTGINNAFEDIKTGNFYNKSRSDAAIDATADAWMGGNDFGSDDDFGDFNLDDWDDDFNDNFEDDASTPIDKGDILVFDTVAKSSNLSAQLISKTVANTSSNIINANIATTKMTMSQNVQLVAGIRTSIAGVHESINSILKFSTDTIVPHMQTQSQFFSDSMNIMKENNAILKEMLEMQRNVYKKEQEEYKLKDQFGDVFSGGTLDIAEYAKAVFKNAKGLDKTGTLSMMLNSNDGEGSMLSQMLSNPLGIAVTWSLERFMNPVLAKSVASFSKTLGNIFPVLNARLLKLKDKGGFLGAIGELFGLSSEKKDTIDTSKYNKGAVPFDGITRKAIVEVIPEHLSKIESLLSNTTQRTFDYESGKWISTKEIKNKFDKEYSDLVKDSFAPIADDIKNYIKGLEKTKAINNDTKKSISEDIYKMMLKTFEDNGGYFSPEDVIKNYIDYGFENDDIMINMMESIVKNIPLSTLSEITARGSENKRKRSTNMSEAQSSGLSVYNRLFNNSNDNSHLKYHDVFTDKVVGTKEGQSFLNIKDEDGENVLSYLKKLLINVSYIREFGGSGGGRPYDKWGNTIKSTSFDNYSNKFNTKYVSDEIKKLEQDEKNKAEAYDKANYDPDVDIDNAIYAASYNLKKNAGKHSNLDEDEFKNIGKWYKDSNKWQKELRAMPGDTFIEKWSNAQNFKTKQALILGSLSELSKKPAMLITGTIDRAEKAIYNFLFKAETDDLDDEGKPINGVFNAILSKMRSSWDLLTTKLEENVINPLVDKLGLKDKWDNFKNKIKDSKPGEFIRNAASNVKDSLKRDIGSIYGYSKSVFDPVIHDKNFASKKVEQIKKNFKKSNAVDREEFTRQLSELTQEELDFIKQEADPALLKAIEDAGFYEGGEGIVEESGSIQVSEGERIKIIPNKSGLSEDRKKELRNGILQELNGLMDKRSNKTRATFAKVKRINDKAREVNSTAVSDTLSKAGKAVADEAKNLLGQVFDLGENAKERAENIKKERNKLTETVGNIVGEMKGEGAPTISKAIIGGGLGLLSGVVGGPLIGAGVGTAYSLIKNSETIQKFLFGEKSTDDEGNVIQKGGIVSKNIQDTFKKYIPDMGKFSVIGGLASLLTPFGPLAGAAIGAGVGLAKNSQTMQEMIFGEEGLLNEDRREKIKKFLPKAAVGAAAGMFLGPFGLLGNAALGAGVGMLTGTQDFKELIFGEEDENGNRFGGLKGALQEHFIDPLKDFGRNFKEDFFGFVQESIINPLNDAITPIASEIAFQTKRVVFGIPKWFLNLGKDYIAMPIVKKLEDYVISPIAEGTKKLFGGILSKFKGLVSLPFRAIGGLGNMTRKHQIKQGRNTGTAKDRLKFAEDKGIGDYSYRAFDETLKTKAEEGDTDWLEELTARTGMLAHGSDHFEKEVKRARRELSNVVSDYYKLGWFAKDKKSYKRIRQYIHDNDIESAINELTEIQESRTTGAPLDKEANDAIARFSQANKKYQVARDTRDKFANVNEEDNAAWMEKHFGSDWRSMKTDRLFEYARKESAAAGGKKVSRSDLFKDPTTLVTKGEEQINETLNKIFRFISGDKTEFKNNEGHVDEDMNNEYDEKTKIGIDNAKAKLDSRKKDIMHKLNSNGFKFAEVSPILDLLYQNPLVYDLVLTNGSKGINYDHETIMKLCRMKLNKKHIDLLKEYPFVATLPENKITKDLNHIRNNKGSIFGAKKIRNNNLGIDDLAGRINANLDKDSLESGKNVGKEEDSNYMYQNTNYGLRRFIKDQRGKWTVDLSDSDTKESLQKEKEEETKKNGFFNSFNGISNGLLGFLGRDEEKDEEEKKEPWYKKLFKSKLGMGLTFGAAILGLITGVGAVSNAISGMDQNTQDKIQEIKINIKDNVGDFFGKITSWMAGEGDYAGAGLPAFMEKHVYPNLFAGMNVIFEKVMPAVVTAFIVNLPELIKGALKGVGKLFGWTNKEEKANVIKASDIKFGNTSAVSPTSDSSGWFSKTSADANNVANTISSVSVNTSTGDTTVNNNTNTTPANETETDSSGSTNTDTTNSGGNPANDVIKKNTKGKKHRAPSSGHRYFDPVAETDGENAKINGENIYIENEEGKKVKVTDPSILSRQKDIWTESGIHYVYDKAQGGYVSAEEHHTSTESENPFLQRVGGYVGRALLTGRQAPIVNLLNKPLSKNAAAKAAEAGTKAATVGSTLSKTAKSNSLLRLATAPARWTTKAFDLAGRPAAKVGSKVHGKINSKIKATNKVAKGDAKHKSKLLKRVKEFVNNLLRKVLNDESAKKVVENGLKETGSKKTVSAVIETIARKIGGEFAENLAKKATGAIAKIAAKANPAGLIITAGLMVADFLLGIDKAEAILEIENPTTVQKLLAGLANCITNQLTFGLIDVSVIINILVDHVFPIFNIDTTSFKAKQEKTREKVKKYNEETGDNLSTKEYLKRNHSVSGKISYGFSKLFGKNKDKKKDVKNTDINKAKKELKFEGPNKLLSDQVKDIQNLKPGTGMETKTSTLTNIDITETQIAQHAKISKELDKSYQNKDMALGILAGYKKNGKNISLSEGNKLKDPYDLKNVPGFDQYLQLQSQSIGVLSQNTIQNTQDTVKDTTTATTKQLTFGQKLGNWWRGLWGKGTGDTGFVSQVDPKYANKKFNTSKDTEYQTLGDSGCAPATAANVINLYSGMGNEFNNAANAALKFKDKNSGVTPDYFENYLGHKGINTQTTVDKRDMINSISSGQPTILLGQDPSGRSNTPYGPASSHYVLATGVDGRGNIIVQDPESRQPNALYPAKDLINQSQLGVITSKTSGFGTHRIRNRYSQVKNKINSKFLAGRGSSKEQIEQRVWSALRGAGYSEVQVAGVMGNIKHESGFDPSIVERGNGIGFGLCQWSFGRRTQIENFAKSIGKSPNNVDVQITFLIAEMNPKGGANGYASYAFTQSPTYEGKKYPANTFQKATDIETATKGFCYCFERPNAKYARIDKRISSAKEYYSKYTGLPASSVSIGDSSMDTSTTGSTASNIFDAITNAAMSYYDEGLMSLFGFNQNSSLPTQEQSTDLSDTSGYDGRYSGGKLEWPVPGHYTISSDFGPRNINVPGASRNHRGIDISTGGKSGPKIVAAEAGKVITVNTDPGASSYGKYLIIDHGSKLYTLYAHCSNIVVSVGDIVSRGQKIAEVGSTGRSSGPHLHFEVRDGGNSYTNNTVDPKGYLSMPGKGSGKVKNILKYSGKGTVKKSTNNMAAIKPMDTEVNGFIHVKGNIYSDPATGLMMEKSGNSFKQSSKVQAISGKGTSSSVVSKLAKSYSRKSSNISSINNSYSYIMSGKGTGKISSLPTIKNSISYTGSRLTPVYSDSYTTSGISATSSTDKLLTVIIEVLTTIANNSEKLSQIVELLSKALDLNLTDNEISKLSSNSAQIKNKITNALKSQGSANGMGSSIMNANTESLASAMYAIARA